MTLIGVVDREESRGVLHSLNDTPLHHKYDAPNGSDVFQRISIKRNDVRLQAGRNRMAKRHGWTPSDAGVVRVRNYC